jgi:DNA-binding MarR family transcriptional regulator
MEQRDYTALAEFRYSIRRFLRFSKDVLAQHALTPEQYEALLALRGFAPPEGLTIGQLSERLQVRHHSTVGLVAKLVQRGLLARCRGVEDRRAVFLTLTEAGSAVLEELATLHRAEMRSRSGEMIAALQQLG